MKKLLSLLFLLIAPISAWGQTTTTIYRVDTIAALKAIPTSRPPIMIVTDATTGGEFKWGTTPCSAADDVYQVTPTSGPTGCWTRMANTYAVGADAALDVASITVGGAGALQTGVQSGFQSMWGFNLLETFPGDLADITWRANSSGIQTNGIWAGNTNNYVGISTRFTRATDPPNVTRATNGATASGNATLHFASTDGVTVGDFVNGSANIPLTARVASKTATTVVMDTPTTGSGVASGVTLDFIGPYAIGTWMAYGNNNVLQLYALASDTVKPTNALMALAQCTEVNTYCSGANIIAFSSTMAQTKQVGMEIDQMFPVGSSIASVSPASGGLYINTFNGSGHSDSGNGPGIQLGGIDGYWSNGFICDFVAAAGSCFGMGSGGHSVASMADSFNGTFGVGAYLLGNDTGSNNQRVVFRAATGANAALYMDSSNVFHVSAAGRTVNVDATLLRAISPNELVASMVSSNVSGYGIHRVENSSAGTAFDYGVDNNGGAYLRALSDVGAGTAALTLSDNNGAGVLLTIQGGGNIVATGTLTGVTDITATGTIRANTAFSANGSAGLSATTTVRDAAGTGTCTLIFTFGIKTGGTC